MSGKLIELKTADFDATIGGELPVFVDFWAPWCGPCRMITPFIEQLADEFDGKAVVCKVNVDDEPAIAERFGVTTIPTVMLFKNGELVDRGVGARPKKAFEDMINRVL